MPGIINLDAIASAQLFSLRHNSVLENGHVCNLGALAAGETDVFTVAVPATATLATEAIVLVATPEIMADESRPIGDFTIPAGANARGVRLVPGNIVTISDDMITGATVVGQHVVAANASLRLAANAAASGRFSARVIEKGVIFDGGTTVPASTILVINN